MVAENLRAFVEAALMTSRGPVPVSALLDALKTDDVDEEAILEILRDLKRTWEEENRGIRLESVAGGWRCHTPPELDEVLRTFHGLAARQKLTQAALEVLSVVGYRQPVTLPEINFVRGANSTSVVKTLLDRRLIRIAGRKKVVGKPFLYRTTKDFLVHFGLESIDELPDPEKILVDDASEVN